MVNDQANAAAELLSRLGRSADVYPQGLDLVRQGLLLIQFDANAYRAASFLDDRILTPQTRGGWVRIDRAMAAAPAVENARPVHFIFHTGHVGSTLVSRLLEESGCVLGLREPLPLRVLAGAHDTLGQAESLLSAAQFDGLLAFFARLWSRGYDWARAVVVKATSSAGRLAGPLLTANGGARAVWLNLRAEPYLATLLAGANSPIDLRGHGAERIRRLSRLLQLERPAPLYALSLGELAAMSWLAETATQHQALQSAGARCLRVDFDQVLADVPGQMARIAAHFALPIDAQFAAKVAGSAALTRYAKAPEHEYSPALRAQVLNDARRTHGEEIRKGLAWLEATGRAIARAAAVLQANA